MMHSSLGVEALSKFRNPRPTIAGLRTCRATSTKQETIMPSNRQELAVMNEKQILRMTNSPFIVRLAATFNGASGLS